MLMPVICLNISVLKWCGVPLPGVPKFKTPGLVLLYATSSSSVFTATVGFTTKATGIFPTRATALKSVAGLQGRFL